MKHRKLRIAWSVAWGIAAVLLIALWVQSYWRSVEFESPTHLPIIVSAAGLIYGVYLPFDQPLTTGVHWDFDYTSVRDGRFQRSFYATPIDGSILFGFPHWAPVCVIGMLGPLSWLLQPARRYSLRTLLIVTTLVAVGLGLIVYFAPL